jgi:hypothetical protein
MKAFAENRCVRCNSLIWSSDPSACSQSTPGIIRAAAIAFENKVGCEIGSAGCTALQELSKSAVELYSVDSSSDVLAECRERKYHCPVEFLYIDPLRDPHPWVMFDDAIEPEVFFWWLGYPTSSAVFTRVKKRFPDAQMIVNCNTSKTHLRLWKTLSTLNKGDPELRFYTTDSCVCGEPIFLDVTGASEEAVKAIEPAQSRIRTSLGAYREGQHSIFATYNLDLAQLSGPHRVDLLSMSESISKKK